MKQIISSIILLLIFFSCQKTENQKELIAEDIRKYPKDSTLNSLKDLVTPSQYFKILGKKDTVLVGKQGSLLYIPANSFIDQSGTIISDTIEFELTEALTTSDIVLSNLQTVTKENLLESGGMIFINAKSKNKQLAIQASKNLRIEIPTRNTKSSMKTFNGYFNNEGKIVWEKENNLEKKLIPIPLSFLNFDKCRFEGGFDSTELIKMNNSKYENTFIATREFEERACSILLTLAGNCSQFSEVWCGDSTLLEIYLNNTDKKLGQVDSIAFSYLYNKYKDEIDESYEWNWDEKSWHNYFVRAFREFKDQKLQDVIDFKTSSVNYNSLTISKDLQKLGLTKEESERLISLYKTRTKIIEQRADEQNTNKTSTYAFNTSSLGWVNVDRFFNLRNAKEYKLNVKIDSKDTFPNSNVFLIFPKYNIFINGSNRKYSDFYNYEEMEYFKFTKKGFYSKLPFSEKAHIIIISTKNGELYFGSKKIVTGKNEIEKVELTTSSKELIKDQLDKIY